jgi:hypothetical protein
MGKMAPVAVGADPVLDEVPARPTRTVACPGPTVRLRQAGVGWHNSTEFSIFGRLIGFFSCDVFVVNNFTRRTCMGGGRGPLRSAGREENMWS